MPLRRPSERLPGGPVTALSALILFAAVTALRFAIDDASESVTVLYVVPVALLAITFGTVAGLCAAALGLALFAIWDVTEDAGVGVVGYLVRAAALFLVGGLVGELSERLRNAERRAARLADAEALSSGIVQQLTVARLALERGDVAQAQAAITETAGRASAALGDRLPDDPRPGDFLVRGEDGR